MYHAKESGRGRVAVFDDTMRARAVVRHTTENDLHRALEHGELLLFFQPVVSLRDARCVGAEALVRWQHPERGLMVPDEFVPLAEETGLVVELGRWVLEAAADEAARWQVEHEQPFVVSVNLSARQLAQPGLAERLSEVIERSGVAPREPVPRDHRERVDGGRRRGDQRRRTGPGPRRAVRRSTTSAPATRRSAT